jgi:hypothetical protein
MPIGAGVVDEVQEDVVRFFGEEIGGDDGQASDLDVIGMAWVEPGQAAMR